MSDPKNKKKAYEPPLIREIGGVFEQAMGVSACATGNFFSTDPCARGTTPGGGCANGSVDQACAGGGSDASGCSRGFFATGGCSNGPGGG
jgi:hypothetical protein